MANKTWIFDYDDTLATNQHYYTFAQLRFVEWVIQNIGMRAPDGHSTLNRIAEIDKKSVEKGGFAIERFPSSLKETYRVICQDFRIIPSEEDLQRAYDIGMQAYDKEEWKRKGLVEGAEQTLDFLLGKGDELMLLTKGDRKIQEAKLEATRCKKWFGEKIYIVGRKDEKEILKVVGDRNKSRVWLVGNSIKSDINPGLEAGINVIYIPCETWAYERDHKGVPKNPKLTTVEKISGIMEIYSRL